MGRRPIGKKAMSGAEHQRRYMARLLAKGADPVLVKELENAKARITQLEKHLGEARTTPPSPLPRERTLTRQQPQEQQWRKLSRDERRTKDLEAKVRELEALVLPLDPPAKDALTQHKRKVDRQFKARWKQNEAFIRQRTITMDAKDYRLFLAGFHPEASAEIRDKARNRFEALYQTKVITPMDKPGWPP